MIDPRLARIWLYRALFLVLAGGLMFVRLLPITVLPSGWPGPDVLTLLAFAWVLRRPDFLPPLLLALVFLAADLMFLRPPGLWAACVLVGAEFLRSRQQGSSEMPFLYEWAMVAGVLLAMTLAYQGVLALAMVETPRIGLVGIALGQTILVYPAVAAICRFGLGVRQILPGTVEHLGRTS